MDNNFDINKLNSFLDQATQAISCDSECQKQKIEEELKDKYLSAKANLTLAEPEFQLAKRNYYTYVSGENGYNEMMEQELSKITDKVIQKYKEIYREEIDKIKSQLDTYTSLLINFRNVLDLDRKYKSENKILYEQLKTDMSDVLTNERKTYYENQVNDNLNNYYYYIFWVIYIITVILLIIFSLTYPSQSSFNSKISTIVFFIILPFISTWLLGKIIGLVYYLAGFIPKNVYQF